MSLVCVVCFVVSGLRVCLRGLGFAVYFVCVFAFVLWWVLGGLCVLYFVFGLGVWVCGFSWLGVWVIVGDCVGLRVCVLMFRLVFVRVCLRVVVGCFVGAFDLICCLWLCFS